MPNFSGKASFESSIAAAEAKAKSGANASRYLHHLPEYGHDCLMNEALTIREYAEADLPSMIRIWNEVVEEGNAFPQEECLTEKTGKDFFASQSRTGVAVDQNGVITGLYILHPNNIGRCGHICNASYAVDSCFRGLHTGEKLVRDSMEAALKYGFRILQFNAVVSTNMHARHLYERLGFIQLGTIKNGFRKKDGSYEDICPYYITL